MQAVLAVTAENVLDAHSLHSERPALPLYVPAAHAVHAFDPEKPALQTHSTLPATESALGPHSRHADEDVAAEYFPPSQFSHSALPATALKVPAAHPAHRAPLKPGLQRHEALPLTELEFASQASHSTEALSEAYLLAGHKVQASGPLEGLYFPGWQAPQASPAPTNPALQKQATLPDSESALATQVSQTDIPLLAANRPGAQFSQGEDPESCLYLPGVQAVQDPSPAKPATHKQTVLPATESELVAQTAHAEAAVEAEYFPASQSEHAALPVTALKVPAAQPAQLSCSPVYPTVQSHVCAPGCDIECPGQSEQSTAPASAEYLPAEH